LNALLNLCKRSVGYKKKIISDSNLIESLNRYIAALEGKADMQSETLRELKQRLKEIVAKPRNKRRQKNLTR